MGVICTLLSLYLLVMFAAIILSWFPLEPGGAMASIYRVLWQLTAPVLAPVRRLMPDLRVGGMSLDLSPLVVLIGIQIIQKIICN